MMQSKNPATGDVLAQFDEIGPQQIEDKLARAHAAFLHHRRTPFAERAAAMRRAGELMERDKQRFAALMTQEMGKTLKSAVAEAEKCAWVCRYYAEYAEHQLADEPIATDAARSYTRCLPLGPVLAVMPWNFPFWQVFRFAAPALMAGNVGLLKHASNVPQCALAIEDVLRRAGFADGVFQTLLIGASRVAAIIDDPRVAAVTLTGSEGAGAQVGAAAGKALKKCVLELGGSDPFIVHAVGQPRRRRGHRGQGALHQQRPVVHRRQALPRPRPRSTTRSSPGSSPAWSASRSATRWPTTPTSARSPPSRCSPTSPRQVDGSVAAGARLLCGGKRLGTRGNFYAPTVLADLPAGAPAYREEVFGPVASLFKVADLDAAIALANASPFGLGVLGVDHRRGRAAAVHRRARRRHDLRQRHGRLRPAAAVRRRQALRPRPRAVGRPASASSSTSRRSTSPAAR